MATVKKQSAPVAGTSSAADEVATDETLVEVFKGGESIEVHPTCVKAHLDIGWSLSEK